MICKIKEPTDVAGVSVFADAESQELTAETFGEVVAAEWEDMVNFVYYNTWRHATRTTRVCWPDAENVVQHALLQAWKNRSKYDPGPPLANWLWGYVRMRERYVRIASYSRKSKYRPLVSLDAAGIPVPVKTRPEDEYFAREARREDEAQMRQIKEATSRLVGPQRIAITCRYVEGDKPRDIAEREGVTRAAIESRLLRGRATIRGLLGVAPLKADICPGCGMATSRNITHRCTREPIAA